MILQKGMRAIFGEAHYYDVINIYDNINGNF
jgi:hypothetical protein